MYADSRDIIFECKGEPGMQPGTWEGTLRILRNREFCEAEVEARGSHFHLIVGRHSYGNFVCIPNWDIGTEISDPEDIFWNTERLQNSTPLKKVDACSVASALDQIHKIKQLQESVSETEHMKTAASSVQDMTPGNYTSWDECPEVESCELIGSFLKLVDSMVRDIQHLKAETIRARYELSMKYDPEHKWITTVDILSNLDTPHYDSLAYQEYMNIYYDGGDPMSFKEFSDSMVLLAKGIDDNKY